MYVHEEPTEKLIIELAPTGMVPTKEDNPHVPVTPAEIVDNTYEAYRLGASVVHVHARDRNGAPAYSREIYSEIFTGIRDRCPGMIICASTSGRVFQDFGERSEVLDLDPEMASLTPGTVNFHRGPSYNSIDDVTRMAALMRDRGIKPELEIFEPGFINTAKYLQKKGYLVPPLHFNLLLGSLGSINADMRDLVYLVESLPDRSTWMAAGIGRFQLQVNTAAILMGGHVRVGLEDSVYYTHARKDHATNGQLVRRVVRIAGELGREIASPEDARRILGIGRM